MSRGKFQSRVGTVIGDKMDKTVVVDVIQIKKHKRYMKSIKRNTRFLAHDESGQCKIGDKVLILEARPYSKTKRWKVSKILEASTPLEAELIESELSGGPLSEEAMQEESLLGDTLSEESESGGSVQ